MAKNPSELSNVHSNCLRASIFLQLLEEYVTKFDLENYINVQLPKNIASNFKPLYLNYTLEVPKIGNLGLQVWIKKFYTF